jgi:hypothetical protein
MGAAGFLGAHAATKTVTAKVEMSARVILVVI